MPFDRRWLLTAAGSAFLASLFEKTGGASAASPPTASLAKDADSLFELFQKGFPRKLTAAESKACRLALDGAYIDRFTRIFPGLDGTARAHLQGFAQMLGTLTYACLENQRKGTCGWAIKANPVLGKEHILVARELLGFYVNLPEAKRCDPAAPFKVLQPDEPCPLCPVP